MRAQIFYCPFCGEQDLRPTDDGSIRCEDCLRVFTVSLAGIGARDDERASKA